MSKQVHKLSSVHQAQGYPFKPLISDRPQGRLFPRNLPPGHSASSTRPPTPVEAPAGLGALETLETTLTVLSHFRTAASETLERAAHSRLTDLGLDHRTGSP